MNYFITAINTDSGKTFVAAILCEALGADYWKPIQAGLPLDSETVKSLVVNSQTVIHPETYRLRTPASPHAAAKLDGLDINLEDFVLPKTSKDLIIEGAGGCLVPINDRNFVIDLAIQFQAKIILVSNLYLGSINHTLLTFEALKHRNMPIHGLIFNGISNPESERIILQHTHLKCLLRIAQEKEITPTVVKRYALQLRINLKSEI